MMAARFAAAGELSPHGEACCASMGAAVVDTKGQTLA